MEGPDRGAAAVERGRRLGVAPLAHAMLHVATVVHLGIILGAAAVVRDGRGVVADGDAEFLVPHVATCGAEVVTVHPSVVHVAVSVPHGAHGTLPPRGGDPFVVIEGLHEAVHVIAIDHRIGITSSFTLLTLIIITITTSVFAREPQVVVAAVVVVQVVGVVAHTHVGLEHKAAVGVTAVVVVVLIDIVVTDGRVTPIVAVPFVLRVMVPHGVVCAAMLAVKSASLLP